MISLNWVKDYIDIKDQDLKELSVKITKAGINDIRTFYQTDLRESTTFDRKDV